MSKKLGSGKIGCDNLALLNDKDNSYLWQMQQHHLRKNGSDRGVSKYHCKDCNYHGRFSTKTSERSAKYEQVEQLLLGRNRRAAPSQRGIVHMTVFLVRPLLN